MAVAYSPLPLRGARETMGAGAIDGRAVAFLDQHPECAGWAVVPLAYASRTKKGVLGVFTRAERWCRDHCRGDWRGGPQAFAFADAGDADRFRAVFDGDARP